MNCCENKTENTLSVKYEKSVNGINTEYQLTKNCTEVFEISVSRNREVVSESFAGDFFDALELFKLIVNTDTLPENLCDISEDYKNNQKM